MYRFYFLMFFVLRTRNGRSWASVLPNSAALEVCQDISSVQIIVLELGSPGSVIGWTVSPFYAGRR